MEESTEAVKTAPMKQTTEFKVIRLRANEEVSIEGIWDSDVISKSREDTILLLWRTGQHPPASVTIRPLFDHGG